MSHKNDECIVNVRLDKTHYDFLFTLATAYGKSPEEVLKLFAENQLDKAAERMMKAAREGA